MYTLMIAGYGDTTTNRLKAYTFDEIHNTLTEGSGICRENPSYVARENDLIFTMSEVEDEVPLAMYQFQQDTWEKLDEVKVEGGGIAHISYSKKHQTLFGACYQTGHIVSIGVEAQRFGEVKSLIALPKAEDGISRAHCVQLDPSEHYLYVTNIHTEKVYSFEVEAGVLKPNTNFEVMSVAKGTGPRDIFFHPHLPVGYITGENGNKVIVVQQDRTTGELTVLQEMSTLPQDFDGVSYCANGCVTPNGKYLYVANRGANNIASFEIQEDGTLSKRGYTPTHGDWPRLVACTPDGAYFLTCNQRSNQVMISKMNQATGEIGEVVQDLYFEAPAFVQGFRG